MSGESGSLLGWLILIISIVLLAIPVIMKIIKASKYSLTDDYSSIDAEKDDNSFSTGNTLLDNYQKSIEAEKEAAAKNEARNNVSDDSAAGDNGVSEAQNRPRFWLVAKGGYMLGRVWPIMNDEIIFGKNENALVRYPNKIPNVSIVHAKLYWDNERLMLLDCNFTYSTYLKRMGKLTPEIPVEVRDGDIICIGDSVNSFEIKNGSN